MNVYGRHEAVGKGGVRLGTRVNYWAVLVAAATSVVTSALWYGVFGNAWLRLRGIDPDTAQMEPEAWPMAGQFARNLVVAFVLAYLLSGLAATTLKDGLWLGLLVWFGFRPWPSSARCCTRATRWGCT